MTIKTIQKNGQEFYEVTVSKRSSNNSSIRVQKYRSGIKTLVEAKKIEKEMLEEAIREIVSRESSGDCWQVFIEKWERALSQNRGTPKPIGKPTAEDYITVLRIYTTDWNKLPVRQITRVDVRNALEQPELASKSNARKRGLITAINSAIRWGIESGTLKDVFQSPTVGIKVSRIEKKRPEILTLRDVRKLLEMAKTYNHPWYPVWAAALLTGMRSGELQVLEWSDINWEARFLTVSKSYNHRSKEIKETKAGYWRDVPINSELELLLKELKLSAGTRKEVLPRFRDWTKGEAARVLRTFCNGIGIPSIKFHALRACFATQLLRNSVAPAVVMKVCGWKDLKTMQYYIRLAGIEIDGATASLKLLTPDQTMGKVLDSFCSEG